MFLVSTHLTAVRKYIQHTFLLYIIFVVGDKPGAWLPRKMISFKMRRQMATVRTTRGPERFTCRRCVAMELWSQSARAGRCEWWGALLSWSTASLSTTRQVHSVAPYLSTSGQELRPRAYGSKQVQLRGWQRFALRYLIIWRCRI